MQNYLDATPLERFVAGVITIALTIGMIYGAYMLGIWFVRTQLLPEAQEMNQNLKRIVYGDQIVRKTLLYPDSVKWVSKKINKENKAICYTYKAKNEEGGYTNAVAVVLDGKYGGLPDTYLKYCPESATYEAW